MIIGIARGTKAGHIARASLESVAYQLAGLLDAMQEDSGIPIKLFRASGGAPRNDSLLQFQADLLGVPAVRSDRTESTSLGAAFLAGLAVGLWKNKEEVQNLWKIGKEFPASRATKEMDNLLSRWHQALGRAKAWNKPEGILRGGLPIVDKKAEEARR